MAEEAHGDRVPLKDRIVLVTGTSRREGLGFAIARAAANEGAIVLLTARDGDVARRLASEIDADAFGAARGHALDITGAHSVAALRGAIERDHGRLDVLINNAAGINAFGETTEAADLGAARRTMDVTLFGTWAVTQAMLPLVRESDHGRIVMVSSGAGSHGDEAFGLGTDNPMGAAYGASKAALNALTHRMAREEAKREGSTLRINAVCPGFTATFEGGADMGARPPAESAKGVLWATTLPDDGPTGAFFRDGTPLSW